MEEKDTFYKILIFSDTHGNLKKIPHIKNVDEYDYLLYLGDGYFEVVSWYETKKPKPSLIAVTGNCDPYPVSSRQKVVEIDSLRIFMTHGDAYGVNTLNYNRLLKEGKSINADIVLFGHTHHADHIILDGIHLFNPGSIFPRNKSFSSVGYMEVKNKKIHLIEHLMF